jgi:hypothetical protein
MPVAFCAIRVEGHCRYATVIRGQCPRHTTLCSLIDRRLPLLPLAPRRGREPRLARGRCVGPDHGRLAILPLDGDGFVTDLEAARIDGKVAEHGLGLQLQQGLPELVGVEAAGPLHGVREELAAGVGGRRVEGGRAGERPLIGRDELPVPGVGQVRLPGRPGEPACAAPRARSGAQTPEAPACVRLQREVGEPRTAGAGR